MTRLRCAVIGAGRMGGHYARILTENPRAELVALVGNSDAGCDSLRSRFAQPVYGGGDLAALWANHSDLDAVIVATPDWAHEDPAVQAAERGLHLLVEKPLAHRLDVARRMAAAAAAGGKVAMVCHTVRFDPRFALMQQAVAAGAIGKVRHMHGRRNADQRAYERIKGKVSPAYWLSPHDVDLMLWVAGSPVTHVRASHLGDGLAVDLTFACGATGRIENSWATPPQPTRPRNCFFDVMGHNGAMEVNAFEQGLLIHHGDGTLTAPDTLYGPELHGRIFGVDAAMIGHFLECCATGARPAVGMADALATVAVAAAMERSLESGATETVA